MKKIMIILTLMVALLSLMVNAELFDDFNNAELNLTKWTVTQGAPIITSNNSYEGNSIFIPPEPSYPSDTRVLGDLSGFMNSIGRYVMEVYAYETQASGTVGQGTTIGLVGDGNECNYLDEGYPTVGNWGYIQGGNWADSGISSVSGNTNVRGQWLRIRILVDNGAGTFSVRFANTTSNDISDIPWHSTCYSGYVNQIYLVGYDSETYYDQVSIWNYDSYGWDGPIPPVVLPVFPQGWAYPENIYDGDFDTFGYGDTGEPTTFAYFNYSAPNGYTNQSKILYRLGDSYAPPYIRSVSQPDCIKDPVELKILSWWQGAFGETTIWCNNGVDWIMLENNSYGESSHAWFYESAVNWTIAETPIVTPIVQEKRAHGFAISVPSGRSASANEGNQKIAYIVLAVVAGYFVINSGALGTTARARRRRR